MPLVRDYVACIFTDTLKILTANQILTPGILTESTKNHTSKLQVHNHKPIGCFTIRRQNAEISTRLISQQIPGSYLQFKLNKV